MRGVLTSKVDPQAKKPPVLSMSKKAPNWEFNAFDRSWKFTVCVQMPGLLKKVSCPQLLLQAGS